MRIFSFPSFTTLVTLAALATRVAPAATPLVIGREPIDLPIVSSLDDLKKQPELNVDGIPLRLGIEADHCPEGTGVLVYCLWNPANWQGIKNDGRDHPLGPLQVKVTEVDAGDRKRVIQKSEKLLRALFPGAGPAVAVTGARIPHKVKYLVEVLSANGDLVARRTVTGQEADVAPWLAVLIPNHGLRADLGKLETTLTPTCQPVVPSWEDTPSNRGKTWWTFLPKTADPDLTLSAEDGNLVLKIKNALAVDDLDQHIAARWWVNAKPIQDSGRAQADNTQAVQMLQMAARDMEITLHPSQLAETLHAAPGDTIEVEILYSPGGLVPSHEDSLLQKAMLDIYMVPAQMSNRVKFKLPPEPK